MQTPTNRRLLLRLAPSIYGPTVLFALGQSALVPTIPVLALQRGAELGAAGVIAAMLVVGQLIGSLPASVLVSRLGERAAMLAALGIAAVGGVGIWTSAGPLMLALSVALVGFAGAAFALGRQTFMTVRVPFGFRSRALSLLGGANRVGRLIGPLSAAATLSLWHATESPVWVFLACLVLTAVLLIAAPDPDRWAAAQEPAWASTAGDLGAAEDESWRSSVGDRLAPLLRVGGAAAILAGLRTVREVLIPLWGVSLGLHAAEISLIIGMAATADLALFYLSGQIMDRKGRVWAAFPAASVIALSFFVLAATAQTDAARGWLVACTIGIGIGNSLSSGVIITLGADLAPQRNPTRFLAAWRTLVDFGGAAIPFGASALAAVSLPLAAAATGGLAVLAAAAFAVWLPRYIPARRAQEDPEPEAPGS